ncbi:MAG: hypothetical protein AAFR61_10925 [Bacteroidota bacterium]
MKVLKTLERIQYVDYMIRTKSTGRPKELASKIGISESGVYELIKLMKYMGAPIYYSNTRLSYCYEESVKFEFGFIPSAKEIYGGKRKRWLTPELLECRRRNLFLS